MDADIVTRARMMDGVEVAAISEIGPAAAHKAVEIAHRADGHSQDAASAEALNASIESGRTAVTN